MCGAPNIHLLFTVLRLFHFGCASKPLVPISTLTRSRPDIYNQTGAKQQKGDLCIAESCVKEFRERKLSTRRISRTDEYSLLIIVGSERALILERIRKPPIRKICPVIGSHIPVLRRLLSSS
jgi:hypothetical protein